MKHIINNNQVVGMSEQDMRKIYEIEFDRYTKLFDELRCKTCGKGPYYSTKIQYYKKLLELK